MINEKSVKGFDVVSPFQGDIFVGHLSTPITTSSVTKSFLSLLPAYKAGLSPLLRGINIGFIHGYFLLGPFIKFGPLRDSEAANFIGFVSTISLIIILTTALLIYGFVILRIKPPPEVIRLFVPIHQITTPIIHKTINPIQNEHTKFLQELSQKSQLGERHSGI